MDVNHLRSIVTVLSMLTFVGIVVWAWRRTNRANFDQAAMLPFADDSNGHTDGHTNGREEREDKA